MPGEAREVDDPARLRLWTGREILVHQLEYRQRQCGLPMTHEPRLEVDVVAYVAQVVGKTFVQREVLAVDRHGDVTGITAAPDDAGLGKQQ